MLNAHFSLLYINANFVKYTVMYIQLHGQYPYKFRIFFSQKRLYQTQKNMETSVLQFKTFTHQVPQKGPAKSKNKRHLYTCESTRFQKFSSPQFHLQTGPIDSTNLLCISLWHEDQNRQMQGTRTQLLLDATWSLYRDVQKDCSRDRNIFRDILECTLNPGTVHIF